MKPFFCRVGSKKSLVPTLLELIPPHTTYVEPFVGGGALLFGKEPSKIEIINDLDEIVIETFLLLTKVNTDPSSYDIQETIPTIQDFVNSTPRSLENKLLRNLYISCNTYASKGIGKIYHETSHRTKINKIAQYKERIRDVKIYNKDYKTIIEKYDSPNTFFFLDPPYEESNEKNLYKNASFNYEELQNILQGIKGKFLLTLNDSDNIRGIFKDFIILGINIKAKGNIVGGTPRKEVFIMNYHKT